MDQRPTGAYGKAAAAGRGHRDAPGPCGAANRWEASPLCRAGSAAGNPRLPRSKRPAFTGENVSFVPISRIFVPCDWGQNAQSTLTLGMRSRRTLWHAVISTGGPTSSARSGEISPQGSRRHSGARSAASALGVNLSQFGVSVPCREIFRLLSLPISD
jgi:hypothetical protein